MSTYNEEFNFENGVLNVRLTGKFPNERLRKGENVFKTLIDACESNKCRKIMVDVRELAINFSVMDMFQACRDSALLTRSGFEVAFLARKDMLNQFFEDVSHNRGGQIGVFTELDLALDWLRK
ncbi:MAG TPA: hypothetical protein VLX91_10220 [Candidatus Acidoferrales bacterium]|nr:hypothetical protein [Candidatus Acidoferrales bacterium]